MEGKRAATIVALGIIMLLLGQQQVVAMSNFCACYTQCYKQCRVRQARWICVPKCLIGCGVIKEKLAALTSAADCSNICQISICGTTATDASGAAACVDDCTKNQS